MLNFKKRRLSKTYVSLPCCKLVYAHGSDSCTHMEATQHLKYQEIAMKRISMLLTRRKQA
jgi:hypothetical protein